MVSEFEFVELVFENCNFVRLLPEYVEFLNLDEITTNIWTNAVGQYIEVRNCKSFEIKLDIKALSIKTHFENEFAGAETFEQHLNEFKDITCVSVKKADEKEFCIGVPWSGDDMMHNPLQKTEYEGNSFTIKCELEKG
jgi:translation elongation factor EF-1beta